jgi:four helix bundle protein
VVPKPENPHSLPLARLACLVTGSGMQFDHEKLEAYQLELCFIEWLTDLLDAVHQPEKRTRTAEVIQQIDRASLSMLLNTAEGNGKRQGRQRAKFFDDARGSATECAACLDALVAKRICRGEDVEAGKEILVRVVSILTKLIQRFDEDS